MQNLQQTIPLKSLILIALICLLGQQYQDWIMYERDPQNWELIKLLHCYERDAKPL